jgi:catechol 2,3-dioxygenase-like lactoylglutathione lyase family enzyme
MCHRPAPEIEMATEVNSVSIKIDHVRLDVSDIEVSESFYSQVLELRRVVCYELADRVILQMAPDGIPPGIELWQQEGLRPAPHATQHVAFSVNDVPGLTERVRSLGYRVVKEPFRIGDETVSFIADPDGHVIELNDFRGRGVAEAGSHDS